MVGKNRALIALKLSTGMTFAASIFAQFKARARLAEEMGGMHGAYGVAPGIKTVHFIAVRDVRIVPEIVPIEAR